jgi:phosphoribosylformylglycinamidine synthase
MVEGLAGGEPPKVDVKLAKATFLALHKTIYAGAVRACHDLSEGGLAVAIAEMAFAGGLGATISLDDVPRDLPSPASGRGAGGEGGRESAVVLLFSESNTRFLCEVRLENATAFEAALSGIPNARIGQVTDGGKLEIQSREDKILVAEVSALKEAWQKPLRW